LLFDFSILLLVCFVHVYVIRFFLCIIGGKDFFGYSIFSTPEKLPAAVDYLSAFARLFPLILAFIFWAPRALPLLIWGEGGGLTKNIIPEMNAHATQTLRLNTILDPRSSKISPPRTQTFSTSLKEV